MNHRPPKPNLCQVEYSCPSWPRYGESKCCEVCAAPLPKRRRTFCSERCRRKYFWRMYLGIHWSKRLVIVRDGCACRACGEVFMSAIREIGVVLLPQPRQLELDHVVPLIDRGPDIPSNWQLLCPPCHKAKTSREAGQRAIDRKNYLLTER